MVFFNFFKVFLEYVYFGVVYFNLEEVDEMKVFFRGCGLDILINLFYGRVLVWG